MTCTTETSQEQWEAYDKCVCDNGGPCYDPTDVPDMGPIPDVGPVEPTTCTQEQLDEIASWSDYVDPCADKVPCQDYGWDKHPCKDVPWCNSVESDECWNA